MIIRENLEGEYSGIEHEVYPGVFESVKIVTRKRSMRLAEFAFDQALITGRKKISVIHKANIMKMVDGLFIECTREVSKKYPMIEYEEVIVDNACMQMVKNPGQYDMMLMPSLYGSILTSLGAGLVGGAGVTAGAAFSEEGSMMFEPGTRKSGTGLVGKNLANPTSMVLSGVNLLKHCGLLRFADVIKTSLVNVYTEGKFLTPDVGGKATSEQFTNRLVQEIKKFN